MVVVGLLVVGSLRGRIWGVWGLEAAILELGWVEGVLAVISIVAVARWVVGGEAGTCLGLSLGQEEGVLWSLVLVATVVLGLLVGRLGGLVDWCSGCGGIGLWGAGGMVYRGSGG
jgi:hypothetical protein